jgi:hypothetical protein
MTDDERRNGHRRSEDAMIDRRLANLEDGMTRIFDAILGPEMVRVDGTPYRDKTQGLAFKVDKVDRTLSNGVKPKLPKSVWAAILTAIVSGIFQLITALV